MADLIHDRHLYNYYIPLNVGYITANINKRFGDLVETKILKFPDDLINTMKSSPPDILGLSNYDWNVNLNKALIKIARQINPEVFIVMGGPNIKKKAEGVKEYLLNHPTDLYVVNEGEDAFAILVEYILGAWPCNIKEIINSSGKKFPSVAYLQKDSKELMLGPKPKSALEKKIDFPSPWLTGLMDPFLNNKKFPLQVLVETNRNCPYQCHFCVWGDFDLTKIRIFDYDVVIEELRYIFKRAEQRFTFMIADANVGILNRDVQIAEELRRLADKYGKIDQIFIAQAKNSVDRNLEIAKILNGICIPEFAVQTLTPGILEQSGRRNLSNSQIKKYIKGVKDLGNEVYTDILVGLPGETKKDFYTSMQNVIDFGFQRAAVGDIRLLDGSVYAEDDYKKKHGIKSLYRVIPSAYGEYGGIKVIEYEKCIRETNTMSDDDFQELRRFNAHFFLLHTLEIGKPLMDYAEKYGIHPIQLVSDISGDFDKEKYPTLNSYLQEFNTQASTEWFNSEKEASNHYLKDKVFNKLMKDGFSKLNYTYAAKLLTNYKLRNEFLNWVAENVKNKLNQKNLKFGSQVDEIADFCVKRILEVNSKEKTNIMKLSEYSANFLTSYLSDYKLTGIEVEKGEKVHEKKGEYRDLIGKSGYSKPLKDNNYFPDGSNFKNQKNNDLTSKIFKKENGLHKNIIKKIQFDIDESKTVWLDKEIKKFGGDKNLLFAAELLLAVNQKAFLRSFSISDLPNFT